MVVQRLDKSVTVFKRECVLCIRKRGSGLLPIDTLCFYTFAYVTTGAAVQCSSTTIAARLADVKSRDYRNLDYQQPYLAGAHDLARHYVPR